MSDNPGAPVPAPPPPASPDPGAPAPIDVTRVAYVGRRLARLLGWSAAAFLVFPVLAVAAALAANVPFVVGAVGGMLGWWMLAGVGLALASFAVMVAPFASSGTLRREDGRLVVDRPGRAQLEVRHLEAGFLVPDGAGMRAELHLEGGDQLHVDAPDADTAEAVLRLAGVDAAQQRARIRLANPISRGIAYLMVFGLGGCTSLVVAGGMAEHAARPLLTIVVGLCAAVLASSFVSLPEITVGTDGVSWRRGPFRSFVPLSEIEDVRSAGVTLTLLLRGGRRRTIHSLTGADPARAAALARRVREALSARGGEHLSGQLELLDRRGRSVPAWSEALAGLARAGSSYRAVGLSADDLAAIVTSPDVTPERRLGAALALRGAGHPAAEQRIRVAAAQCASGRLRIALEKVGDGAVDHQAIDEALAETEAAAEAEAARR